MFYDSSNTADSNKMNQRLKEMFKERITSFRECVYLLTGYKVRMRAVKANLSLVFFCDSVVFLLLNTREMYYWVCMYWCGYISHR